MAKIEDGVRIDGRDLDELRELEAESDVTTRADGSAYFATGNTRAIATVHGPRELHPRHLQDSRKAYLKYFYNMAPFATEDRNRPGPGRRAREIGEVSRQAFNSVIELEEFPKAGIEAHVEIVEADAGTRCAAINAASIALADAGIPMKDLVASCAAGKVDGEIVLDVKGKEDTEGEVDLPIAYVPAKDEIALLQMDGQMTPDEFRDMLELAKEGCMEIYEEQKKALKHKYNKIAASIPDKEKESKEQEAEEEGGDEE